MLKTVGITALIVLVLLIAFALLTRYGRNPLDTLARPAPATASTTSTTTTGGP